jgi:long-chain acyl-CoA synthetase
VISEVFRSLAGRESSRLAIIDGDQRITYAELLQLTAGVREWLRSLMGGEPRVIASALDNSWRFAACFLAASELGCSLMPCNPQWRAAELQPLAERLDIRAAIVEPQWSAEWRKVLARPGAHLIHADSIPAENGAASSPSPGTPAALDDAAVYLSTSGSSGTPGLVPRSHRNLIAIAENVGQTLGVGPGWRLLSVIPLHYANGFNNSFIVPLWNGATVVMMAKFNPGVCAELVEREQINTLFGSPFLYSSLLEGVSDARALAGLKNCFSAGGRMPAGLAERWHQRFAVPIRQLYGMTEVGVIAIQSAEDALDFSAHAAVGLPIRGVEIAILGPDSLRLAPGEVGEIAVRSAAVMAGYAGDAERGLFHAGFFRTGDLGSLDSSGRLHLAGRIGRVINIAGVKVDPVEVERVLEMLPAVASCLVDTVDNGAGGQVIRARVLARAGCQLTRREVIDQCRRHLADYKFPRVIEFLGDSALTIAGKILKSAGTGSRT